MKNFITRMTTISLLVFGLFFGHSIFPNSSLTTQPAYAIENESESETAPSTNPAEGEEGWVFGPTHPETTPTEGEEGEASAEGEAEGSDPSTTPSGEESTTPSSDDDTTNLCTSESGVLSYFVCPAVNFISKAIDGIYGLINDFLVVPALSSEADSPIYLVWQYMRQLTNIVFVIFLLIIIYSQITGLGINNYGVKRTLPRLIIAIILVNLSYIICMLAVDVSNIVGYQLRNFFQSIQEGIIAAGVVPGDVLELSVASVVTAILSGGTIVGITLGAVGGAGIFWMLIPVLIGGVISVAAGLVTIAARQAVVTLLVMIAPLAFVAYLLPNTEKWFTKWKDLLTRMLVFYPMFSFLFGASQLAGWALIASATNGFGILLGLAVQIFPIFFSISLMKMSGTFLSTVNNGLRNLANPIRRTATGWATEHAERSRQTYWLHSNSAGSHLRQYLDTRRELRLNDTRNAMMARRNRALTNALLKSSSITGRDEQGNTTWESRPNTSTQTAKAASYYNTLASAARLAQQNTLTAYGRHFKDPTSQHLAAQHGDAFLESMAQQYLAVNEAEADQKALLDQYFIASKNRYRNPYMFNRLVHGAAGGLGHDGEASIMGQVIANSAMIEDRRKREATIISTKFSVDKGKFRAMTYDMASISDNGYETNEDGIEIEDSEYQLKIDPKTGQKYQRRKWPQYIGVHKTTDAEITKEEYDALSDEARRDYNKVRYYEILDDNQDPIQRVYETDAGYMKVLLRNDINIGDPINRRYGTTTGLAHTDDESTGALRRYHSTISAAIVESRYREHAAGFTSMLAAQLDRGFITDKGQLNIAEIQSFTASGKAGMLQRNDGKILRELGAHLAAMNDDTAFAYYFPDKSIANYRDVNGIPLDGWRLMTRDDGTKYWQDINHNDPNITLEDKKNLLRYKILPKGAAKVINSLDRKMSPSVLEDMKKDGLEGLNQLFADLSKVAIDQATAKALSNEPSIDNEINIFDSEDPNTIQRKVRDVKRQLDDILKNHTPPDNNDGNDNNDTPPHDNGGNPPNNGGNSSNNSGRNNSRGSSSTSHRPRVDIYDSSNPKTTPQSNPYKRDGIRQLEQRKARYNTNQEQYRERNSYETIRNIIDGYFAYPSSYDQVAQDMLNYFSETEVLKPHLQELKDLIDEHRYGDRAGSLDSAIYDSTHTDELEMGRIDDLYEGIIDLIDSANTF